MRRVSRRHALMAPALLAAPVVLAQPLQDPTPRKAYANCRYGQIHYRTAGQGAVPLVCLHISPVSGAAFYPLQDALGPSRRVLCFDTPGYGGSDRPPSQPMLEDYVNALAEAIDSLGLTQIDLMGFHTGSALAIELAAARPSLVRRLVLPGIPFFPRNQRDSLRLMYAAPRPYFSEPASMAAAWQRAIGNRVAGQSDDRVLTLFAEQLRAGTASGWAFDAVFRYAIEKRLPQVMQPVLIPLLNDMLTPHSRNAAKLLPNASLLELPQFGAEAFEAPPTAFVEAINGFLS
jgi:pimeloyl-ACP methyl ester carboxylesterase